MYFDEQRLRAVWFQNDIPVIVRRNLKGQGLRIRLEYSAENFRWLRGDKPTVPVWNRDKEFWEAPKAWFNDLVDRFLDRFGKVYIIQPHREQEKCSPACKNAVRHECQCSCLGKYHGAGNDGSWFEVSDTFACRWKEQELACRLMVSRR